MKAGTFQQWISWCMPLQESKFYPSSCSKGVLVALLSLALLCGLLMQEGMVDTYNAVNLIDLVLGTDRRINPATSSESGSAQSTLLASSSSKDVKCLSRAQHMLHRPASQVVPSSPDLDTALRAYEKRHAECSRSHGQNWTETFLGSLNGSSVDNPSGCQFLIYIEGGAGLGNRLISLVSAFLFALFTNRVLLMESRDTTGQVAKLLCEPFPDSSWILPQSFPLDLLNAAPDLNRAIAVDFNSTGNVLRLNLDHAASSGDQRLFCAETRHRIQKIDWVSWTSNQYFVPRLLTFPEFWPRFTTLFPNPSHVFIHLGRYLLLPHNMLWEKIFRIYSSYLSSAENLVGIQIRRHSVPDSGEYSALAFERVFNCLVSHHILPNISSDKTSMPKEQLLKWMSTTPLSPNSKRSINKIQQHQQPDVTTVLIASLQQRYAEELQDLYTNFPTTDGRLVRVHIVTHEGREWHSLDQAEKAFVEMWLLSFSDSLATSSWSTFGYVAQGLGAVRPYIVNLRGDLGQSGEEDLLHDPAIPNSHCVLGQSPEPCNHYPFWPKTDCGNQSAPSPLHQVWLDKHLSHCQDELNGCQLVL